MKKYGVKIIGFVLCLVAVLALMPTTLAMASNAADLTLTIDTGASVNLKDTDADGCYEIGTADELYAFAAAVNGGNSAINGKLTADITINEGVLVNGELASDHAKFRVWTPIGNGNEKYIGTFDGGGHSVSGLYVYDTAQNYVGLFGNAGEGHNVQNVSVIDSYLYGGRYVAGVVGNSFRGRIEHCYNQSTIRASGFACGGVIGYSQLSDVTDCCNTGTVIGENNKTGGVFGVCYYGTATKCCNIGSVLGNESQYSYIGGVFGTLDRATAVNCYNTGDVRGNTIVGGLIGENYEGTIRTSYNTGSVTANTSSVGPLAGKNTRGIYENCYYLSETKTEDGGMPLDYFSSGELTYLLSQLENGEVWGQDLDNGKPVQTSPTFTGAKVYPSHSIGFSNTQATDDGSHTGPYGETGICPYCGAYEPAELKDGYFEIENAGQLFWFAEYINKVDRAANAKLLNDIDLENKPWTPIGSTGEGNHNFRGHFDGQGHTITGLNVEGGRSGLGFFGEVRLGTVENFTIYGEVKLIGKYDYVGGVIGSAPGANSDKPDHNGATIRNITSYVNVTLGEGSHGSNRVGGFMGYANHETLIENCTWYGTLDLGPYRAQDGVGGLVGKTNDNSAVTIRNCAAYGTIKTSYQSGTYNDFDTIFIGGIVSNSVASAQTSIENTIWAGTLVNETDLGSKAHISAFGSLSGLSESGVTNCYALDNMPYLTTNNAHNDGITAIDAERLESGEVAYKLGDAWGQKLGEDARPVLGGEKIHYAYTDCRKEEFSYSNTPVLPDHETGEGHICSVCGLICGSCGEDADWIYDRENATLTIFGTGTMADYDLLANNRGFAPWYDDYCDEIKTLVIEEGITHAGAYAFIGCRALTSVSLPESLTSMGRNIFYQCSALERIRIPDGIKALPAEMLGYCQSLKVVELPAELEVIGSLALTGTSIERINLPDTVKTIGSGAFSSCKELAFVELPYGVTSIAEGAFSYTPALKTLEIPATVTTIDDKAFKYCTATLIMQDNPNYSVDADSVLFDRDKTRLISANYAIQEYTVPDTVQVIGENAFYYCLDLTHITIGPNVKRIEDGAFIRCARLAVVNAPCTWEQTPLYSFGFLETGTIPQINLTHDYGDDSLCVLCGDAIETFSLVGANMTLGNDLKMNFMIRKADVRDGFVAYVKQGEQDPVEVEIWDYNSAYCAASYSVAAKEMTDLLSIEIYDADGNLVSKPFSRTVAQYALTLLNNPNQKASLKSVIVDMLNYGTEAQKYFGYRKEAYANAEVTEDQQTAYATGDVECVNIQDNILNCAGANLSLENSILLNVFFNKIYQDNMTATVSFVDYLGNEVTAECKVSRYAFTLSKVTVDRIVLADARRPVTVTLYDGETVIGCCVESVESYIARNINDTKTGAINMAIMKFATSAYNYLGGTN